MSSVSVLILILVAILAAHAAPANKGKTLIPFQLANADLLHTPLIQVMVGNISVGTPEQHVTAAIFTGNVGTWLGDTSCRFCGGKLYDETKSSTFKDLKTPFKVKYVDNDSAEGTWTTDKFYLGNLAFTKIPFGRVNDGSDFASLADTTGALGLGLGKSPKYESMLQHLSAAENLHEKVFSIRFAPDSKDAGEIQLGGVDHNVKIHYTQIIDPEDWRIPVNKIRKGNEDIAINLKLSAQVETSTPFIFLEQDIVEKIYKGTGAVLFSDGLYILPKEFPEDVTFFIGTTSFTVPKANMWVKAIPQRAGMYRAAIQIADKDTILGIPFVRSNYMVFDFGKRAIGFGIDKSRQTITD